MLQKIKLSVSQLSKFESGQTMLSADKMLEVIEGINLTFSEFGFALRNYKPTQHQLLMNKISKLSVENDKQSLLELLDKYKESQFLYDKLNTLVIKNAIHLIDRDFTLSLDDSKFYRIIYLILKIGLLMKSIFWEYYAFPI